MKTSKSSIFATFSALGFLLAVVAPASATVIDYSTSGVFTPGGTNVLNGSTGGSLTFNGFADSGDGTGTLANPSSIELGDFLANLPLSSIVGGTGTFTLTVSQAIEPSVLTTSGGTFGTLTGQINNSAGFGGTLYLTFNQTSFTIDGVNYQLENLQCGTSTTCPSNTTPNTLAISTDDTTLNAFITATPEPGFYGLTAAGLLGLFAVATRRKRREV